MRTGQGRRGQSASPWIITWAVNQNRSLAKAVIWTIVFTLKRNLKNSKKEPTGCDLSQQQRHLVATISQKRYNHMCMGGSIQSNFEFWGLGRVEHIISKHNYSFVGLYIFIQTHTWFKIGEGRFLMAFDIYKPVPFVFSLINIEHMLDIDRFRLVKPR